MTDVDELSRRVAAQGRIALVERLRSAYREAASVHADIVSLDEGRLEALVQNAADHADGLQWRRALAGLVADELGVSVAEALAHPAVARAQSIVGAPSYEQSLAELITRPIPPPLPARTHDQRETDTPWRPIEGQLQLEDEGGGGPEGEPSGQTEDSSSDAVEAEQQDELESSPSDELESAIADDTIVELLPPPDPSLEQPTELHEIPTDEADGGTPGEPEGEALDPGQGTAEPEVEAHGEPESAPGPEAADGEPEVEAHGEPESAAGPEAADGEDVAELRVAAIHLGGVANLPTGSDGLDLRLSPQGLDIMRGGDTIIGRLPWQEIEALEVPAQRRRRRNAADAARLVVRTRQGDASFEIPGVSSEELRHRVELRIDRYRDPS